jgi:hypothetical protein
MRRQTKSSIAMVLVAGVMIAAQPAWTQQIYRWVDENDVVHYGETVPAGVEDFEPMNLEPAPPAPAAAPQPPAATVRAERAPSQRSRPATAPAVEAAPAQRPEDMSLDALDRACEAARESAIAPLRAAAIEECKAQPRADPAYCERYYATFGDAVGIRPGVVTPRMFDDLPACVTATEERSRRAR